MKLVKSNVIFDSASHTYTLDGKLLSGITSLLSRQLFKDKYLGIADDVLQAAAERGTIVHQSCELMDFGFESQSQEAINYKKLKEQYGLVHEDSEYLVSDNEFYASCIDKVYRDSDNTFTLGDIKTTYKLDKEYVQWQLSIYAYLFEKQNPEAKVNRLFAIWLRGEKAEFVELDRIADAKVEALLHADSAGVQYIENLPSVISEAEQMIVDIETQLKALEKQKKALQEGIMRAMVSEGLYSWKGEKVSITRKMDSIRETFDKERFKQDHPELYAQYIKESPVSGSITFKVK